MSMPRSVRHINESRVLRALFEDRGLSRADLARKLGLTRSTIGNIVATLMAEGFVSEKDDPSGEDIESRSGRPSQGLDLNSSGAFFVGADIGADRLCVVALDLRGDLVVAKTENFDHLTSTPHQAIGRLAEMIRSLIATLDNPESVRGICLTLPGVVDKQGVLVRAPSLDWKHIPARQMLVNELGEQGTLLVENDANAFAAGELYRSRDSSTLNALCVFIDTGVGGAIISDGRVMRGYRGYAGEVGHIFLGTDGFSSFSSLPGTFESFVGIKALLARYAFHGGGGQNIEAIIQAFKMGEQSARKALDEWAWWLGRGLAVLTSVLDPEKIVIGGALAELYPHVEQETIRSLRQHLLTGHPLPPILVSGLRENAAAIGGAAMLHHDFLSINQSVVFEGLDHSPSRMRTVA